MIRSHAVMILVLLFPYAGPAPAIAADLLLRDRWQLQSSAKVKADGAEISTAQFRPQGWYPTSVPATVLAALVANKVYPDPYYGLNLKSIPGYREGRWLAMPQESPFRVNWWYRTEFLLPRESKGRHLSLHFDGINYQANIWLNGRQVAQSKDVIGMFRRFEFDVSEHAQPGQTNYLAVEIIPPGLIPDIAYQTKQVEATTGWDDHNPYPPDMNMGLWQDVYVRTTGPVALRHPYVAAKLDLPSLETARLTVSAELQNKSAREVTGELSGTIETARFSQKVTLGPRETREIAFQPDAFPQLNLRKPRVWWPNPIGPQELYNLKLAFSAAGGVSDRAGVRFGIREATTYLNDEGWRAFRINGRNVLIRGAAWMTSDMLLRLPPRRYEALIRYARNANFNMLRSEGFSIRETDEFYRLCDENGIMVTQQIFGRSIPDEPLAVANVKDMILRIRNHPSLVHFLGHDEAYPTPTLDKAYRALLAQYTPERTYQPHSGAFDVNERQKTGGTRTGTRELWTYAGPAHYYTHKEDGAWGFAQSGGIGGVVAPWESMRRMMPPEALWPPWTKAWSFHTVIQGGSYFDAMLQALSARYGKATGLEDFCLKAQALNYESARGMYEAYGRNKYSATGITSWKYDAAWPASPTWQYVDWFLMAGGAYYGAKKACEPLHVQYSYDDHSIYVVNGYYRDFRGLRVAARLYNLDMTEKYSRETTVEVAADGKTKAFAMEWPADLTRTHFLSLSLSDSAGKALSQQLYWLSASPDIPGTKGVKDGVFYLQPKSRADFTALAQLPRVKLNVATRVAVQGRERVVHVTVENPTRSLAFLTHLAVTRDRGGPEVTPTFWDDNYFALLPGEKREFKATVTTEDLAGAKPFVRVSGWNVEAR